MIHVDDQSLVPQDEMPEMRNIVDDGVVWWVVVDFIRVWTESSDPANYWRLMKKRADPELKAFMGQALRKYPFKAGDGREDMRAAVCDNESLKPSLLGQEMGHGYGLKHSQADDPNFNPLSCEPSRDYRDPWDVMSTACAYMAPNSKWEKIGPGMNAWNMRGRGWLDESRVWIGTDGIVELRPLVRHDLPGFLAANVDKYLVEFRVQDRWDAAIPRPTILVHRFEDGWLFIYYARYQWEASVRGRR